MDAALAAETDATTDAETTDGRATGDASADVLDSSVTLPGDGALNLRDALAPPPPIDAAGARPFDSVEVMVAASPSDSHACWVTERGDVWCAGSLANSRFGALADGDAGVDGGTNVSPPRLTTLGPARDVSTGPGFTCVLRPSGEVACVGANSLSQLGVPGGGSRTAPVTLSFAEPIVQIASADYRTYARTASGRLYRWGGWSTAFGAVSIATPQEVTGLGPIADVGAGAGTVCVVTTTGAVHCEGYFALGATRPMGEGPERFVQVRTSAATNPPLADALSVACGSRTCCAVLRDRTLTCWGEAAVGSLGDGTMAGRLHASPVISLANVHGASAIRWVTTGSGGVVRADTVCAIVGAERGLHCWGSRTSTTVRPAPERVGALTGLRVLRGGLYGMLLVDGLGTSYAWGSNNNGCLGLPIRPPPPSGHEYTLPTFVEFR
jgi:alpha-tubulin suppressor-like RCC1 family protein